MARILIIDDDPTCLELAEDILGSSHEIFTSTDWSKANKYIFRSQLDLLLIDINMPGVSGDKVAQILQETFSNRTFKIVLFSALGKPILKRKTREIGADGYIQKDFDDDILLHEVEKFLTPAE